MSQSTKLILILSALLILSAALFLTWNAQGAWDFVLPLRAKKLAALLLVAYAVGVSTLLFQTITHNPILTPSILGFDALYVFLQTALVAALGGLGYALALLGAELTSGISLVMQAAGLADALRDADLVITGEGRIDGQTRLGKVPFGVLQLARAQGVPVIALAGVLGAGAETLTDDGFTAIFPSIAALAPLADTLAQGAAKPSVVAVIWRSIG